jgi:homoserine kinase
VPVKVKAPASSANIGPGFDVLGLALALHNTIELDFTDSDLKLTVTGEGQGAVDRFPLENLAIKSIVHFFELIGGEMPPLLVTMDNRIPLSRGLGSSAATIVGALTAANALTEAGWSRDRIFDAAAEIEGHADNVAAAVYGGLTIAYRHDEKYEARQCAVSERIGMVVLIPEFSLSTAKARAALPADVSRGEAVFNIGRACLLMESLLTGNVTDLSIALEDALHQPWRRALVKDYDQVLRVCADAGAAGAALSGAGPTMIAFYEKEKEADLRRALEASIEAAGLQRRAVFLDVDTVGTATI